ncbi:MAG TPA: indolepyruvate oxidoreductase subunit beta family protein [Steroidobacteraceae bacterium]|nr:indolepyruvate oxidoreductase subunit beta family protein [Steroidobacteraceae bacterium]
MSERTFKLTVAALGGQGGGVLTDWLIAIAEENGYIVQATSVPGVAQRTGATIYYLEFFPRAQAQRAGREPVMALMPASGDVDCVVAAELAEGARAMQRGLLSERTTLIASTHRSYTIAEKSALGRGNVDSGALLDLLRERGGRSILFDMEATAERHRSVISAVLLGAISGAGVLPFSQQAFADAIRRSGIAVDTNLAAFEDAHRQAGAGGVPKVPAPAALPRELPEKAHTPALQPLLERVRGFHAGLQPLVLEGVRRTLDYQDPPYASLYLDRLERIAALDARAAAAELPALTEATARALALWMTFEDTIRVADLKTRATRFERVRTEIRAAPGQLFGLTEFMKPRVAEIAGTLPAGIGRWVLRSPRARAWLERFTGGKQIRTATISGFLLLYGLAGLRRWRRATLRFGEENARIESWLAEIAQRSATHYALAVELARAQRLIKGYGATHERGWRNFCTLRQELDRLAARADGAVLLSRLQEAALADEEGKALALELAALGGQAAPNAAPSGVAA